MKPHDDGFHAAAFYVSKRTPAEWLKDPPAVLALRFKFIAEQPRLLSTWGTWRARRPRRSVGPAPDTKRGRRA